MEPIGRGDFQLSISGHILLTGDFNARIGLLPDYVSHDSDLHVPLPPDYSVDIPISRKSEDHTVNNYGRELLDVCIAGGLRLINGALDQTPAKELSPVSPLEEQA